MQFKKLLCQLAPSKSLWSLWPQQSIGSCNWSFCLNSKASMQLTKQKISEKMLKGSEQWNMLYKRQLSTVWSRFLRFQCTCEMRFSPMTTSSMRKAPRHRNSETMSELAKTTKSTWLCSWMSSLGSKKMQTWPTSGRDLTGIHRLCAPSNLKWIEWEVL